MLLKLLSTVAVVTGRMETIEARVTRLGKAEARVTRLGKAEARVTRLGKAEPRVELDTRAFVTSFAVLLLNLVNINR